MLHSERQSVSDMRAALKRARGPDTDAADAEREVHLLRDALESVTAERDQLTHEVAMVRETVRHNRLASAEAARTSRASDVAPDSFAGQFHAHAERIRELQTELEVRRPPRACMHACRRSHGIPLQMARATRLAFDVLRAAAGHRGRFAGVVFSGARHECNAPHVVCVHLR